MNIKQNVKEYINNKFRIPSYQRGYKWGVEKKDGTTDASILVTDIKNAFHNDKEEYFIQGVTAYIKDRKLCLIDGQQRTTTIFLLLALINKLIDNDSLKTLLRSSTLEYDIRKESDDFLNAIMKGDDSSSVDTQDIFYFKNAMSSMKIILDDETDLNGFYNYLMEHVVMFVIIVEEADAADIFSMMNGQKVYMQVDELVKADILCKSSVIRSETKKELVSNIEEALLQLKELMKEEAATDWEQNAIRSRFAREWDKWLYWWNQPLVQAFYHISGYTMGWLVKMFCIRESKDIKYSNDPNDIASTFKSFQNEFLKDSQNAKLNFERLRKLQKTFESIYNNTHLYNYVGLLLSCRHDSIEDDLEYVISNFKQEDKIKRYALLRLASATSDEIKSDNKEAISTKIDSLYSIIGQKFIYRDDPESVYRMMFMLNVLASDNRGVKFEFFYPDKKKKIPVNFYESFRSAEHIWPKSKVKHVEIIEKERVKTEIYRTGDDKPLKDGVDYLDRNEIPDGLTEHSIGNMAFLHKTDNSKFKDKDPEDKKKVYFDLNDHIYSRSLLYTISQFAFDSWKKENAAKRMQELQINTIKDIKAKYDPYNK